MRITALLSCTATALTDAQERAIRARGIDWVVLNRRLGRVLLDVNGPRADLQWLVGRLTAAGRDPKPIAAWDASTGRRLRAVPPDLVEWRKVAPDIATTDAQGVTTYSRPTTYRQAHTWLGWAPHTEQDED